MFSLMKKQLFSLVMMLAIVVLAGSSAMAQQLGSPAVNNAANRFIMVAGSAHTFNAVRGQATSTIEWHVYKESATPTEMTAASPEITALTNTNVETMNITWSNNSIGQYYIDAIETRSVSNGGCAVTTRRFFVSIIDFDILVYAADVNGARISGTALANCGNGTTARYGDVNVSGTNVAFTNAWQNATGATPTAMTTYDGVIAPQTVRYLGFQVIWNLGTSGATAPTVDNMTIDYNIVVDDANGASAYVANSDLVSLHTVTGTANTGNDLAILFTGATAATNGFVVGDFNCAPSVGAAKGPAAVIPVVVNDRWSSSDVTDLLLDFNATDVKLYNAAALIGSEPAAYSLPAAAYSSCVTLATNKAEQQTIQLAPATSVITAN